MLRFVKSWAAALLAAFALASCTSGPKQQATTIQIAAADNLKPVLDDLARDYTARQPWIKITFYFANTVALEQRLQKTHCDMYIPARAESTLALSDHGAIAPKSRYLIATNQLALVAPESSTLQLDFAASIVDPSVRQIAVVDPTGNMLGYLTHQALVSNRLVPNHDAKPLTEPDAAPIDNIEPKLLVVANEADVLTAIKDGRAQIGITYSTYAIADKSVHILSPLPQGTYEPIYYYSVILRNAPNYEEAWNFLNYLRSPQAQAIMQRDGLLVE